MAESKKRASDSDGATQNKKPKFEKKTAFKKDPDANPKGDKKSNPFQKTGMSCSFARCADCSSILNHHFNFIH